MTVFHANHNHNKSYVSVEKSIILDRSISLKSKALMIYFLSKPPNWAIHLSHVLTELPEGKAAIYKAVSELIKAGYVTKKVIRNTEGKIQSHSYEVHEIKPLPTFQEVDGVPLTGYPLTENQEVGNPTPNNNDLNNNDLKKEKNNYKDIALKSSFCTFYALYPKKKSRRNAEKAWDKLNPSKQVLALKGLEAYCRDIAIREKHGIPPERQFIPYPATWLNSESYLDEYLTEADIIAEAEQLKKKSEPRFKSFEQESEERRQQVVKEFAAQHQ